MADLSPDEPFDLLLKRRLASGGAGEAVCPDAELLAAYGEGRLSDSELRAVEQHAASCARCTHIVASTAAMEADAPVVVARPAVWRMAMGRPLATRATLAVWWSDASRPLESPPFLHTDGTQQTVQD